MRRLWKLQKMKRCMEKSKCLMLSVTCNFTCRNKGSSNKINLKSKMCLFPDFRQFSGGVYTWKRCFRKERGWQREMPLKSTLIWSFSSLLSFSSPPLFLDYDLLKSSTGRIWIVTRYSYFIILFHEEIRFVQISPFRKSHLIVVLGQRINLKALHLLNMLSRL